VEPTRFVTAVLEAFDTGLCPLNEVHTPERLVLPGLTRLQSPQLITAVDVQEDWVVQARELLSECVWASLPGMDAYIQQFSQYEVLLNRDPAKLVQEIVEQREPAASDAEVQELIREEMAGEETFLKEMPESLQVGIFQIGCKDVKRQLVARREATKQLLMEVLVRRLRDQLEMALDENASLCARLRRSPASV